MGLESELEMRSDWDFEKENQLAAEMKKSWAWELRHEFALRRPLCMSQ